MIQGSTQLERHRRLPESQPASEPLLVGKDILELLSTAMYVDPLSIYREYVQNAADAIDEARHDGVLGTNEPGRIEVWLDAVNRTARIRDNGIGIPSKKAERVLTAFGASRKRGGSARGFRGVGRLAALGYAQSLTFRTKAAGELRSIEVRWDCRRLRTILNDSAYPGDLGQVIRDVVSVVRGDAEAPELHYFEVQLDRVIRLKNDVLLNEDVVQAYLSQVAPVPYRTDFAFAHQIEAHLAQHRPLRRYCLVINGSEPVTRPFRDTFNVTLARTDQVSELQLITVTDPDVGVTAVGWLLHHGYTGAIQGSPDVRGLRARVGDIQVGGDDVFADVFPEARFNAWTIGEMHVLDRRVLPNGRRDNFEPTPPLQALVSQLVPYGRDIARRCRVSSAQRTRIRKFASYEHEVTDMLDMLEQGALGRAAAQALGKEIGTALGAMEKLAGADLLPDSQQAALRRRLATLRRRQERLAGRTGRREGKDPLRHLPKSRRPAYAHMVQLIYECASNRSAAKVLVDRITARLVGAHTAVE